VEWGSSLAGVEQGARHVTAVDVSERMLAVARQENALPQITYFQAAIEELSLPEPHFDIVVSSLALHYVEDYATAVSHVHDWLNPKGVFLFSVEHPLCTASISFQAGSGMNGATSPTGRWITMGEEGERIQKWFVDGVVKYHRTVSTYINALIEAGFRIERVEEPEATREAIRVRPDLAEEGRRPPFLILRPAVERE